LVKFEIQTRIARKFGLIFRQAVLGALYARFRNLKKDVLKHNNEVITEVNDRIFKFLQQQGIADPIKIYAEIETDDSGRITQIKVTKIEVYKLEQELNPNIELQF
jgi:hypothetical protein